MSSRNEKGTYGNIFQTSILRFYFWFSGVQVEDVSYWKHFVEETSAACPTVWFSLNRRVKLRLPTLQWANSNPSIGDSPFGTIFTSLWKLVMKNQWVLLLAGLAFGTFSIDFSHGDACQKRRPRNTTSWTSALEMREGCLFSIKTPRSSFCFNMFIACFEMEKTLGHDLNNIEFKAVTISKKACISSTQLVKNQSHPSLTSCKDGPLGKKHGLMVVYFPMSF